ncbi:hypothetical protein M9H77_17246 [Catharanthus roseus]|uniref:Uncharacterized protein n=1 Tax=Catharanthus roseus TaxID=4058 RepID=A0ACC0B435_CATRO|nr:hypothetical protein M9H77_17246 [Catharanthus roseus]
MEEKSKKEAYHSKLARDKCNFYHSSGYGVHAYGGNHHGNGNFTSRRQIGFGVAKIETLKSSMIEDFPTVNELPQAIIEVEESATIHVKEEISNVEHCDLM